MGSGSLTFIGVAGAAATVYALQVAMGRMLPIADYSLYAALAGIFNMVAVPLSAVLLVVTRAVALEAGLGDAVGATAVRRQAVRELAIGGTTLVLVGVATSGLLAAPLGSPSPLPVAAMWVAVGVNVYLALGLALLQGAHRFVHLTAANLASAGARLVACIALVALGFGVVGAMAGIALACAIGAVAVWWALGPAPAPAPPPRRTHSLLLSRSALVLAGSNVAFIAMSQFDYVLVRVFLAPEQASQYAAAAVLAKSVLWLPVGIVIALFPMVASEAAASRPIRHLLRQGLIMAAVTSGALAVVLALGAGLWIRLLYGPKFEAAAPYLAWLSLAYFPMAIVLVVDNHQLALHRARFILAYAGVAAAEVIALALPGATPERLVSVIVAGSLICLAWALWIVVGQLRAGADKAPAGSLSRS